MKTPKLDFTTIFHVLYVYFEYKSKFRYFNLLNYGQDSYIAFKDRIKYVIETIYNGKMVKLDTPTNPVQIDEMAFKRG